MENGSIISNVKPIAFWFPVFGFAAITEVISKLLIKYSGVPNAVFTLDDLPPGLI